ncbi:MAG: NAD(P)-dependent oxidoreductase [Candidatus Moranbacteria bacterium]|nr:NAD(P)-dependent oxidoreductase [Candidatus Moranbacteria bacterium]
MKKIVYITGAAGFIGKNSAKCFSENGWYVVGAGLGEWAGEKFSDWGIQEWHPGLITAELLSNINKKPDVILHCAGGSSVGFSVEHPEQDYEMTVGSAKNVLEFMRAHCPSARLIFPSSAAVYGQKEDVPIKENDFLDPVSPYGLHKKIAEELCEEYSKRYNINVSIGRIFSAYGSGLQKQLLWDACNKISDPSDEAIFFGTGLEKRDWIHVRDIAELFLALASSKNKFEIVNIGSGVGLTIKDVITKLLAAFQKNKEIVFNNISKEGDPKFYTANIGKVKNMGWNPKISLEDGIREYAVNFEKYQKYD